MNVKIKKLFADARIPEYKTEGAACFDIYAAQYAIIRPHCQETIRTGVAVEVPEGHALLLFSRSGHAADHRVSLGNSVGVIDSDYRGELLVMLRYDRSMGFVEIQAGDRIAQGMIVPVPAVQFEEVKELSVTKRGVGGLGSTGK